MNCPRCPRAGLPCTGEDVPRVCDLVDPDHPDYSPAYLAGLDPARLGLAPAAAGDPKPRLAAALRALRLARDCPDAGPAPCSCDGLRDCRRLARPVGLRDCLACAGGPPSHP